MRYPLLLPLLVLAGWLNPGLARAQAITTTPTFFTENAPVIIEYDATQGNGALTGFTGNVYIYAGAVTNLSATPTTWRATHSPSFNTPDPTALMTRIAPNRYTITLTPRAFFPTLPATETITRLAMLFKSGDGTTVGRTASGGDFFIDVFQSGLAIRFTNPANVSGDPRSNPYFVTQGATVNISAAASEAATLTLRTGNTIINTVSGATNITASYTATSPGRQVIRLTAVSANGTAADSFPIIVRAPVAVAALPAAVPVGLEDGVTYLPGGTSAILVLTAPAKQFVYALGEWNGYQVAAANYMTKTPDGNRWWVQIDGLTPGTEYAYQYLIDGTQRIGDPYAEKVLDPDNDRFINATTYPGLKPYPSTLTSGIAAVLQTAQVPYVWQNTTNYQRPKETDLVVYELHIRDFIARHDYRTLTDTLDYLQRLGITAIQLMPVNEFEGNDSWGYNPDYHLALDKYYGPADTYRQFIDACHGRGMAVIMDIALNHAFGLNPMVQMYFDGGNNRPAANSPWFNPIPKHDFNVGYDFNHESAFTKYYTKRVIRYWLEKYHIDGFRFDLSKGFTQRNTLGNTGLWGQRDPTRIAIWKDYADTQWAVDSTSYVILEHFADNAEERELAAYRRGMMPWGNAHFSAADVVKGTNVGSDLSYGLSWRTRGWTRPRLIGYIESHDEERLVVEALTAGSTAQAANGYNVRTLPVALARHGALAMFAMAVPGPKMIWQFGELGYDVSINQNGRTGAKPIRWQYYQDAARRRLFNTYAAVLNLRRQPAFASTNFNFVAPGNSLRTLRITDPSMNVLVIGNYSLIARTATPQFQSSGMWYDYFSGDSLDVQTASLPTLDMAPGTCRIYTTVRQPRPAGVLLGMQEDRMDAQTGLSAPAVYPNPAALGAPLTLAYELQRPAEVRVTVLDLLGRTVATLAPVRQTTGFQTLDWTPTVTAGTYLIRVTADGAPARTVRVVVK